MAAPNEYYDSTQRYHSRHYEEEHGYNRQTNPISNPRYSYAAPPPGPPPNRYGHNSFADESENEAYLAGGRIDHGEEYAENIPLKANADMQPGGAPPMGYPPQPPPQPPSSQPGGHGFTGRGRVRGRGRFLGGRIPWVTYLLTTVQIIVFIVELVKNGEPVMRVVHISEYEC